MLPFVALTVLALAALLLAEARDVPAGRWIAKPLASTGFVATGLAAGALTSTYGHVVLAALVLCWLGDVLLIPKARAAFLAGLVSFLLGHVAFVVAFAVRGVHVPWVAVAGLALLAPAWLALRWLKPSVPTEMWKPVVAYVTVISAMVAMAAGANAFPILLGAFLFYVSDLAVARDRFVEPGFANRLWGLPLYYAATLVLASTAGSG